MDIERRTIVEAVAATVPVVIAVVALVFVGSAYTGDSGFTTQGGQMVVFVLVGLILLLTLVGMYLARTAD